MPLGLRQRAVLDRLDAELRAYGGEAPALVPDTDARRCPEVDCVRALLPPDVIGEAERRAQSLGVGADRVLLHAGLLDEEVYLRALAASLDIEFDTLEHRARSSCPLADSRLIEACAAGLLPFTTAGGLVLTVAPRELAARRIIALINGNPALTRRFRITSSACLQRFVFRHAASAIGSRAAGELHARWPLLSAAPPRWRYSLLPAFVIGAIGCAAFVVAPGPATIVSEIALAIVFMAWMVLRITGTLMDLPRQPAARRLRDDALPVYSVLVALYREAAAAEGLVASLRRLDYPVLGSKLT